MYYTLLKLKHDERTSSTVGLLIKVLVDEAADEIMVNYVFKPLAVFLFFN
jgi:hypothetical protein